ncbi:hypothetical protein [Desulfonatronum thiosulfatophilum]|nr:hypothetical protein [Desulfonatronum thiosulfatophilum]
MRGDDHHAELGTTRDGDRVENQRNFPEGDVDVPHAGAIYEIPNAFAFRGTTYIDSSWADAKARNPGAIALPRPQDVSLSRVLGSWSGGGMTVEEKKDFFSRLPDPVLSALAATSTDSEDLRILAGLCCELLFDEQTGDPKGLRYIKDDSGRIRAVVLNHDLFEAVANNPNLPDPYKVAMVLRPGVQGGSEIVGDVGGGGTHVFEYLRRNSYIPWGHFAANMAHDAVRYAVRDLDAEDMRGLRHLYYQRTYLRLARMLDLDVPRRGMLTQDVLEELRLRIVERMVEAAAQGRGLPYSATLWGWNFGFDFAPSGYRLHASHQQIHQQYALIPSTVASASSATDQDRESGRDLHAFACGDLVADAVAAYRRETGRGLFADYLRAIRSNQRTDGGSGESSLVVYEDEQVLLFVPKAQTSAFELQLMPLGPVGHLLDADTACRKSLDEAMLKAQQALEGLGARMVTSIEYSRRFDAEDNDQRLLYAFLPKLPYAPGGFSEAQLRSIIGHYPEDFAHACRMALARG